MRTIYGLVTALFLIGLAQYLTGGWGVWLVLLAAAAWLATPLIRRFVGGVSQHGHEVVHSASNKPDPPKASEYREAGVDMKSCSKCRKPLKSTGYFFGLDGVPTAYCPSCWSKASSPMNDAKFNEWFDHRLTTKYDRCDL